MTGHIGMGLTPGQAKVLAVIKRWRAEKYISPTVREIGAETGMSSTSQIASALDGLEERGHIWRRMDETRGVRLVERPAPPPTTGYRFIPVSALTWPEVA